MTILHVTTYYPRVPEVSAPDILLSAAADDLVAVFHGMPRQVPPAPVRDMTLGQLRLLFLLRREGPQTMGRIAEVFDLSSTAVTGFVSRIERHGLVERQHRSDDRRIVECVLTEGGVQFLDEEVGVRREAIRSALAALTPRELSRFRRLLGRIRERQGRPA